MLRSSGWFSVVQQRVVLCSSGWCGAAAGGVVLCSRGWAPGGLQAGGRAEQQHTPCSQRPLHAYFNGADSQTHPHARQPLTLPRAVVHAAALHPRRAALDADAVPRAAADVTVLQDGAAALHPRQN